MVAFPKLMERCVCLELQTVNSGNQLQGICQLSNKKSIRYGPSVDFLKIIFHISWLPYEQHMLSISPRVHLLILFLCLAPLSRGGMIIVESVVKQIREMPMMPISAKVCYIFQTQFISCFLSIELLRFAWSSLAAAGTNLLIYLQIHFDVQIPNWFS